MGSLAFEPVQNGLWRSPQNIVDFMNLIELVLSRKQRILGNDLVEDAPVPPNVHLVVVVAVCHEAFRGSVPSGGDVLCVGTLMINSYITSVLPLHDPRSASFTTSPEIRTFSGLISLWKMLFLWMKSMDLSS